MVTEDQALRMYRALGARGYAPGEQALRPTHEDEGPTLLFGTELESLFLADMTGDGLTDIVRIRRTSVEYWPNRGYGRFGARVIMDHAPAFDTLSRFHPSRIRLADTDGTGPTDIVYLGPDGVDVYVNASGNRLGDRQRITSFLPADNVANISIADLRGDGTACLVWSSPLGRSASPLVYLPLMKHGKPHLLQTLDHGMGRTTTFTYTPSTAFFVADRRDGTPWATRLSFPVMCLSKVETLDAITGWRFASTYSYHHGTFDGVEREFRGFGLVVQRDTEAVTDFVGADPQRKLCIAPSVLADPARYQPIVR